MHARDLAELVPTVTASTDALTAATLIAGHRMSSLVVADETGLPIAVFPGSQVLKLVIPRYVREDPSLAHVYDDVGVEDLCAALRGRSVSALLEDDKVTRIELPSVHPDDTLVEIASTMIEHHTPLVVVRDDDGTYTGAITFARTMAAIVELARDPAVTAASEMTALGDDTATDVDTIAP